MNLTAPSLRDSLEFEFRMACADLTLAQQAVRAKDTPAARARLSRCMDAVDAILDRSIGTACAAV